MFTNSYTSQAEWLGIIAVQIFIILFIGCISGVITLRINQSKGYSGGFQWGFFLGIIGIIIVACRPYEVDYYYTLISTALEKHAKQNTQSSDSDKPTKRCDYCDAVNDANSNFCYKCGKSFKSQ